MTQLEIVLETSEVAIVRLNGSRVARDPMTGHHREVLVYVPATLSERRLVELLHAAASRIEKTLAKDFA